MQLRDLRSYCAARQLVVVREYVDVGQSGTKDSRPERNVLMGDVRKRKVDAVICWAFDRVARNTRHLLAALEELRALGIQFLGYQLPGKHRHRNAAWAGDFHGNLGCGATGA